MGDKNSEEFRKINKEISKEVRKDIRKYNTTRIIETIEQNKKLKVLKRQINIGTKNVMKLKDENGNTITNKSDIVKITENFYRKLYKNENPAEVEDIKYIRNQGSNIPTTYISG
ncbi:hypothetical protein RN001_009092 [Aquatica leii]|uniref:Uncharacterized protein n=1 Tax=Aquatica leii TaxID=1421715 RepID=A0AAN7S805_9COLE|nr:hypothetical protein RN001_009092 [Aquatica leii]